MKKVHAYQKGDPEWMIIQKQYHELLDEERESLSEWVSSEEEYDQMRQVLLDLHDKDEDWLEPEAAIKFDLMKKFATEEQGGRLIWLNSVFMAPTQKWLKKPEVHLSLAAACAIGLAVFFFLPKDMSTNLAEQKPASATEIQDKNDSNLSIAQDTLRQFAELRPQEQLPPVPEMAQLEKSEVIANAVEEELQPLKEAWGEADGANSAPTMQDVEAYSEQIAHEDASMMEKKAETVQPRPAAAKAIAVFKENNTTFTASVNASAINGLLNELYTAR